MLLYLTMRKNQRQPKGRKYMPVWHLNFSANHFSYFIEWKKCVFGFHAFMAALTVSRIIELVKI